MRVDAKEMMKMLGSAKNVLLVEPNYNRKYPPLGLAKIKSFLDSKGIKSQFARDIIPRKFDLICVTTLFTYYSSHVFKVLNNRGMMNADTPILVGGVMASILPHEFDHFKNTFIFEGYSKTLDRCVPDPEMMSRVDDPWNTFSYVFTSRGCPNKCKYCVVWRIEKPRWVNDEWKKHIDMSKPNIMISDNNLSAVTFDHLKDIVEFSVVHKKKILFDNGFDCKYITDEMAEQLARCKFIRQGMRLAFDRIDEDGIFQSAVKKLQKAGVAKSHMMAYVLFNFTDRPQDAYYRARECDKLGVRPYPQFYRPLTTLTTKNPFIGKHWTKNLGRLFRNYWLMRGIYSKQSFDDYLETEEAATKFKIDKHDKKVWKDNGTSKH